MHGIGQAVDGHGVAQLQLLPFLPIDSKVAICGTLQNLEPALGIAGENHARLEDDETFVLEGLVAEVDGSQILREAQRGHTSKARQIGLELAETLLARGGRAILEKLYQQ